MEYSRRDYVWGIVLGVTLGFNSANLIHTVTKLYHPVKVIQIDINHDGNK